MRMLTYFIAWFGMMVIAVLNGAFRDFVYKSHLGGLAAHQISTVVLLLFFAGFFWFLIKRWPIATSKQAWAIGGMWFLMTEIFEFGMGRLIAGASWDKLFQAYNLCDGQLWLFIPLWVLIGPYACYRWVR